MSEEMDRASSNCGAVLVIGAGAAGLTAAYDLKRKGIEFKILEANSFPGGRLRKMEDFADFPLDLGGEWIHHSPKILEKIVDDPAVKFNFETIPYQSNNTKVWRHGKWVNVNWKSKDSLFVRYTWYDFFKDHIAKPLGENNIHYNCVVNTIDYSSSSSSSSSVKVTCRDGRTFQGDQVIVTVPLKVLQQCDIKFIPSLPRAKFNAIEQASFDPGIKMFIEFNEKFYHDAFAYDNDLHVKNGERYFWDETYGQNSTKNILGVFAEGTPALRYMELEDENMILQDVLRELDESYGGRATSTYVKHVIQNWTEDEPYIQGLYSTYREGMMPMFELKKPLENKVFFAGEALPCDGWNHGYAHGAALSGRAAANAICCIRDGKKPPLNWRSCASQCVTCFSESLGF